MVVLNWKSPPSRSMEGAPDRQRFGHCEAAPHFGCVMNGRKPNRQEQHWLDLCKQVPCIVCSEYHDTHGTPAEIHHIAGQRSAGAHLLSLSLCTSHHRHPDNQTPKRWHSRHGDGRRAFEKRYAPELTLLEIQQRKVAEIAANYV